MWTAGWKSTPFRIDLGTQTANPTATTRSNSCQMWCVCVSLYNTFIFFTQYIVASSDLENAFVVSLWCDVDAVWCVCVWTTERLATLHLTYLTSSGSVREKRDNSTQASDSYEERLLKQRNLWEESAKAESTATAKELETLRNHNQQLEVCSKETQTTARTPTTYGHTHHHNTDTDRHIQTDWPLFSLLRQPHTYTYSRRLKSYWKTKMVLELNRLKRQQNIAI